MTDSSSSPALIISGPTAVGKTTLSLRLATKLNGEVINSDSVQLYKGFCIGAAKPAPAELGQVKHHLIDILEPDQEFSTKEFVASATSISRDLIRDGKLPVLVGGTTLYLASFLEGLSSLPEAAPQLRSELEELGSEELWEELNRVDPETASRLHLNDRLRVVRALETFRLTGIPASEHYGRGRPVGGWDSALIVVLNRERAELYSRINHRSRQMIEQGLIEETRSLLEIYPEARALKSLGYAQVCQFLKGELQRDQLVEAIAMATRRYAKRQLTFWRNEPGKRGWEELEAIEYRDIESLVLQLSELVKESCGRKIVQPVIL